MFRKAFTKGYVAAGVVFTAILAASSAAADDWSPLWSAATLSQARSNLTATSAGGKVFFAGGDADTGLSAVVDIYDTTTGLWSTAALSQARENLAATSAGGKVFFGGGDLVNSPYVSKVVDIYDTTTGLWTTGTLSQARGDLVATSAGGKVFFGGGSATSGSSAVVDIYDTTTGLWTTGTLSQARVDLAATSAGGKVFFGGGSATSGRSAVVDIYDTTTGLWSTAALSQARNDLAATSTGSKVFFGGGFAEGSGETNAVDICDATSGTWSVATLSQARMILVAASVAGKVFFAGGYMHPPVSGPSGVVDIYDTTSGIWSSASLFRGRDFLAATSTDTKVFFAGGDTGAGRSNVVDIYTSQNYGTITSSRSFTLCDQTTVTGRMQLGAPGGLNLGVFNLAVGSMSGDAAIDLGSATLTVGGDNSPNTTYSGVISGAGSLNKTGAGTLILTGANNYLGGTTISGGTLQVGDGTLAGGISTSIANNSALVFNTPAAGQSYSGAISGSGSVTKTGTGTLLLGGGNTYAGLTTVSNGTLRLGASNAIPSGYGKGNVVLSGTLDLNGLAATINGLFGGGTVDNTGGPVSLTLGAGDASGTFSGAIQNTGGAISVVKIGVGTEILSGSNTYTGNTTIGAGTLEIDSVLPASSARVSIASGATLIANSSVRRAIAGAASDSAIVATTGTVTLGDNTTYTGFSHAGALTVGSNNVTLNSRGFANLGVLTTLSGGTLAAPNGISLGVGCNLSGSGTVNGKVAAGFGSTIEATGNLALGDVNSYAGFTSDGELYTNANTVTLNSSSAANNKNAVVLGSLTQIDGGSLVAPKGILLENGKNLVATDAGGTVSGGTASRFLNRGNVQGPSSSSSNWLIFNLLFKGSTGQTSGRIGFLGGFATGDSPGINTQYGATLLGGTGTEFDIGGRTAGNSDNNYGQLNILTDPNDPNNHGDLTLLPGTLLNVIDWNGFVPNVGDTFSILTWDGSLTGSAALNVDPAFAAHGIHFNAEWQAHSLVVTAAPEPSTLALLGVGAIGLLGYGWRRRKAKETKKANH